MALKRLSLGEMIDLSKPWLDPDHVAHQLLQTIPVATPLLPLLGNVHRLLLEKQPTASRARLSEIGQQAGALDERHDDLIRALFYILTGLGMAAADGKERARLLEVRDRLLPDGLSATNKSYREEAGEVALLTARIDAPSRAVLESIPLAGGQRLSAITTELADVGRRLGETEDERVREEKRQAEGPSAADVVDARNQWIRVVNALLGVIALAGLAPDDHEILLGPLQAAERDADRRAARRVKGDKGSGGPEAPPATT